MKWLVVLAAVAVAVQGRAQQNFQQRQRGNRQLDTLYEAPAGSGYGSPIAEESQAVETSYGAPSEIVDVRSDDLPGYNDDDNLASYNDVDNEAAASDLDERTAADPLKMLMNAVPGIPGEDYPIYAEAPETGFECEGQVIGGYYADPEAECQVFHICGDDGLGGASKYSFLCPNGTIFNQEYFICDWWFNVDCSEAEALAAARNADLQSERDAASARLAEANDADVLEAAASANTGYGAPRGDEEAAASAQTGYGAPADELSNYDNFRF